MLTNTPNMKGLERALEESFDDITTVSKQGGAYIGVATGMTDLDKLLKGIHPGEITFVCSKDLKLKNSFLITVALNAAIAGTTVYFCTAEYTAAQVAMRMLSIESRVPLETLQTGCVKSDDWKALADAMRVLPKSNIHLFEDTTLKADEFCTFVQYAAKGAHAKKLLIVDSENFFSPSYVAPDCHPRGNEQLCALTSLARRSGLSVLVGHLEPDEWSYKNFYWHSQPCIGSVISVNDAIPPANPGEGKPVSAAVIKNTHGPKGSTTLLYDTETYLIEDRSRPSEECRDIAYEDLRQMYREEGNKKAKEQP